MDNFDCPRTARDSYVEVTVETQKNKMSYSRIQLEEVRIKSDSYIIVATFLLLAVSILMVFSTTAVISKEFYGDTTAMIKKHILHTFVGLVVLFLSYRIPLSFLKKIANWILIAAVFLLAAVLIPGIGHTAGGAQRWMVLGPLRLQPGELAKVAMIIFMAQYISVNHKQMVNFFTGVLIPLALVCLCAGLLLAEPDFGSTVIIMAVVFSQLLICARLTHLIGVGVAGCLSIGLIAIASPYRVKRLVAFLDPFADASASGYQLIQSLIAVGSGGLSGAGLGAGKQKLFYLPAAHTDFIFAMIAEELGLFGAIFVLLLFLLLAYRGLMIAKKFSNNPFLCSLAIGCTMLIVFPAFLNIAVVLGLLPTKGMVLPLVAYGGTAMIVHLGIVGLLLNISQAEEDE